MNIENRAAGRGEEGSGGADTWHCPKHDAHTPKGFPCGWCEEESSASAPLQPAASAQIREAVETLLQVRMAVEEWHTHLTSAAEAKGTINAHRIQRHLEVTLLSLMPTVEELRALLGEAPPKAEQSPKDLPCTCRELSVGPNGGPYGNGHCVYCEWGKANAIQPTPGATVQPQADARLVRLIAEVSGRHNTKPGYRHLMIRAPRQGGEIWESILSGWVHTVHADELAERINSFEAKAEGGAE